jgi:hypothetical protein
MSKQTTRSHAKTTATADEATIAAPTAERRITRTDTLIALMRVGDGATAADLGRAVGWQVHSVRGFIAGTLKKRPGLTVIAAKADGVTRYRVVDVEGAAS